MPRVWIASPPVAAFAAEPAKHSAIRWATAGPPEPNPRHRRDSGPHKRVPTSRRRNAPRECKEGKSAPHRAARAVHRRSPMSFAANSPDRSIPATRDRKCKPAQIAPRPREPASSSSMWRICRIQKSPLARWRPDRSGAARQSRAPEQDSAADRPPLRLPDKSLQPQPGQRQSQVRGIRSSAAHDSTASSFVCYSG